MKKWIIALFIAPGLWAAGASLTYDFNTGDKQLDVQLNDLNIRAKADKENFISEVTATFNVDEKQVNVLLEREKMEPAEVYLALRLQEITKEPLEKVVEVYKKNKGKGWGVIAKELGIKPGSPEFHELKKSRGGMLDGSGPGKSNEKGNKGKGKYK